MKTLNINITKTCKIIFKHKQQLLQLKYKMGVLQQKNNQRSKQNCSLLILG